MNNKFNIVSKLLKDGFIDDTDIATSSGKEKYQVDEEGEGAAPGQQIPSLDDGDSKPESKSVRYGGI